MRENLAVLRRIVGDGCLPVTFSRMLPYDGTPIKDELVRTGRVAMLRGPEVSHPHEQDEEQYERAPGIHTW